MALDTLDEYESAFKQALRGDPGEAKRLCRELLAALAADRALLLAILRRQLASIRDDMPQEFKTESREIMLCKSDGFYFAVATYEHTVPKDLYSLAAAGYLVAINGVALRYDMYATPPGWREDLYVPGTKLTPLGSFDVAPGAVAAFDDLTQVPDFHIDRQTLVLKLVVPQDVSQLWTFERKSLTAIGVSAASYQDTNMVYIAEALAAQGSESSIAPLAHVFHSHPRHFVRWAALQALASIDADAALAQIERGKSDRHPHVRAAALRAETALRAALEESQPGGYAHDAVH